MNFKSAIRSLVVLMLLFWTHASINAQSNEVKLTILHTNDTHGHLLPFSYPNTYNTDDPIGLLPQRQDIGGAARRATLVKQIRKATKNPVLLVDCGDICDGTPFSTEYRGEADIAAMNAIGYDYACPGNHEYNNTLAQVRKLIQMAKFPMLSANSKVKADGSSLFQPYVIREVSGVRVALIGLMTIEARTYPAATNDLEMERPVDATKKLIREVRSKADFVIALTHIGIDEDMRLALEVPGIDVIVGGHSHTLLPQPIMVPNPTDLRPNSVRGTVIVQAHQWGGSLGRLDLTLRPQTTGAWTVASYAGRLLPITKDIKEDPETVAVVAKYWDPIKAKYGEVLGRAEEDFVQKGEDLAHYNLVADAVREAYKLDFNIENIGGIRAPLVKGNITYGDMVTLDPFGNTVVTFKATGRQVKNLLSRYRPAVSGIRYVYQDSRLQEVTIGGETIDDDKVYSGATNSYYADRILTDIPEKQDTKKPRLEVVLEYIRTKKNIKPVYDGRRFVRAVDVF